ncbi:MAG: glycosyltransferase [Rhodocyclales bacterium]|nr:glycosyltransferase [Rhodocyclales bacterium]
MHILIEAVGSAGDVHPFLAIGQALAARGHEVDVMTSEYFAGRVRQAGLGVIAGSSAEDYQRAISQPDLWHPRLGFRALWRESQKKLLPYYALLQEHIRPGETVLLGSTLAWSVRLAQECLGVPAATVHLSPSCILSADAPARMAGLGSWLEHLPVSWRRAFLGWVEKKFLDGVVMDDLNVIRAQLGLAPVSKVFSHWQHSPQAVICAFPAWFCAPQKDWPALSVTTGFPMWRMPGTQALSPALQAFLAEGEGPIGFTPGSAMAFGRPFFERAQAACAALGRRAVFVTPFSEQLPWGTNGAAPAFIHHERYVPFDALVPQLAALVHHGGIGTMAQAMHAGVPQLITPFAHDQFDNAARVTRLGCGAQLDAASPVKKWTSTLARLLADPATRAACQRMQGLMSDQAQVLAQIVAQVEALAVGQQEAVLT